MIIDPDFAYGLNVMGDVKSDMTADSTEYNATANAITGVAKLPEKFPLIVTVVINESCYAWQDRFY